jgi:hypothetical protein
MSIIKADGCASSNPNASRSNCLISPKETKRLLWSPNLNYQLLLSVIADETLLKAEIAAGNVFVGPEIYDVRNSTINEAQIAQDNSGNSQVTRLTSNFDIGFGIKIGQCMLRKLQPWNARQVQVWAVDEVNGFEGGLSETSAGVEYLKGNLSQLVFPPSMPRRVNNSDIVYPTLRWLVDTDIIDHVETAGFDISSIDGVVDLAMTVPSAAAASVTVSITEGCNGTAVLGLDTDLEFLDSSAAAQVPTGVVDNGDGTYTATFSPVLSAGTYSVNLDAVTVEVAGSSAIYGALATPKSFTIS